MTKIQRQQAAWKIQEEMEIADEQERLAKLKTYVDVELQQLNQADRDQMLASINGSIDAPRIANEQLEVLKEKSSEQLIKEWAAVTKGTHNWIAMEKWLQSQSDLLKKRADIKKELSMEIYASERDNEQQ